MIGRLPIRIFFGIGPRVPELGQKCGPECLSNATPPTVLDLEGFNLDLYPAIIGRLSIRNFFGIGPRVPELGPKMWSRMLYLCFLLSDWDKIWVVKVFLNCIATSNFKPML